MLKNKNLLYVIAAIIVIFWAIGFLIYSVGAIIHTLLIIAIIAIILRIRKNNTPNKNQ